MLTAILVILSVDLFVRLLGLGANANVLAVLKEIAANTRMPNVTNNSR